MSLRIASRFLVNANLRVSTWRFSSSVPTTENSEKPKIKKTKADLPIEMQNPFKKEKMQCLLCKHNIVPNYKNVRLLSQFQSPYTGRIYGRHITGLCKRKQYEVELEIAKAQTAGFMPSYHKDITFVKDPKLYDPERPIRPHKY